MKHHVRWTPCGLHAVSGCDTSGRRSRAAKRISRGGHDEAGAASSSSTDAPSQKQRRCSRATQRPSPLWTSSMAAMHCSSRAESAAPRTASADGICVRCSASALPTKNVSRCGVPVRVGSAFSLCGEGAATRGLGFGARRGTVIRSGSATIPPSSAWRDTGYVMLRAAGVRSPLCWTALGQSLSGR